MMLSVICEHIMTLWRIKSMEKTKILLTALCLSAAACSAPQKEAAVALNTDCESCTVSYLGPQGTYTEEACELFFGKKDVCAPYTTVPEAAEAMCEDKTEYAVIPQENTIGGAVIDYVDTLISLKGVSVSGEVELPISQNLLGRKDTALSDIKKVYSHKQGIAQSKQWLEQNLPDAQVIEVSSTAEGARMVAESNEAGIAAIASKGAAEVYGLEILAAAIQNNDNNQTRFYILSEHEPATEDAERLAFIAEGNAKDLPSLMAEMEKQKMTLVTLHDRPLKTELGQYYYLIECAECTYADYQRLTENSPFTFTYLGSFNVKRP